MDKLEPCPKCHGDELSVGYSLPPYQAMVQCHSCDLFVVSDESEEDAVTKWNTRTRPAPADDVVRFHEYQPDTSQYAGDCAVCGNVRQADVHDIAKAADALTRLSQQRGEVIEALEALKYTKEQGIDAEMANFNEGIDAAIRALAPKGSGE